ncbi:MAG: glycosyltransferase family 39 protein [Candidatus Omnitrophica bacterium]|nr:glycosyltransferase family 39 protein [Candidatus Omnitrophota bacterium]
MFKKNEFWKQYKSLLIILAVALIYYIHHVLSFRLGMNFEESRDANAYLLAMQGNLAYRDFEWLYGPFSFFVYPFIMKIFGVNLIVLRISYIIFASLVIPLVFFLSKRIMPSLWAGIAAFLSIIFFNVPYYTFNHIFIVLAEIACLLMICRYLESNKKIYNIFWAGIFCSICLLTKPLLAGVSFLVAVSLFLFLFDGLREFRNKINNYLIFLIGVFILPLIYLLYFYSQTALKDLPVAYPLFFQPNSAVSVSLSSKIDIITFSEILKKINGIFPISSLINISSFGEFKQLLVTSFEAFINCLYFIVPISIIFIYIRARFNKVNFEIKEKLLRDKNSLLIIIIPSVFISFESFLVGHNMTKAYNIQLTFILTVYLLYFLKTFYSTRPVITRICIAIFLFYISFLNFFIYPYSNSKRYREPLNLVRAQGILVTAYEKELYESLFSYLSKNLQDNEKIVVMGYYPQLSFLTKQNNIFVREEYLLKKLEFLVKMSIKREDLRPIVTSFEHSIISKIENENPKIILKISNNYLSDFQSISPRIEDFIEKKYSLDEIFGPADILGFGKKLYWVNSYKLKEI